MKSMVLHFLKQENGLIGWNFGFYKKRIFALYSKKDLEFVIGQPTR
tara:strand:+ start:323 stop:460 length:138 start_codon:yes stop_codon:yes gene_type:complete